MRDNKTMLTAVNLYDKNENGSLCKDELPDMIELFETKKEEKIWGYKFFLEHEYSECQEYKRQNPFIAFINNESPQEDCYPDKDRFCRDFLSYVPYILDQSEWEPLKQLLWQTIQQSSGLQFNRFRTEYYCFLIGALMIAETWSHDSSDDEKMDLLKSYWDQFSWMYGMAIGRVIGSAFNNFTAVINLVGQSFRKPFLHLYLPLVENNIDKICRYKSENRLKLENAIRKARGIEALVEQRFDLDELYQILFPKHFVLAMADSRPAATIADLKQKLADRDRIITKLQADIDDVSRQYNAVLEQLKNAVNDVENDRISGEDLTKSFLMFPADLALSYFGTMSTLLALNHTWQKYAPQIHQQILAKQKELQDRQITMDEAVKKSLEEPRTQINNTLELVQKKETNIDKNYGPNIEHNGGTLTLPKNKSQRLIGQIDEKEGE
jgi:hypothetical protein